MGKDGKLAGCRIPMETDLEVLPSGASLGLQCHCRFHRKERASPGNYGRAGKILWDYRFFRNLDQTERSGWHKVMDVLQQTDWGKQQVWLLSGLKMGNETLPQKLNTMYTLLCSAHTGKSHTLCPLPNPEEVATAHKLVGYCMKDEELDYLKRLALHGNIRET